MGKRRIPTGSSSRIPIKEINPAVMQEIGREGAPIVMQLKHGWPIGRSRRGIMPMSLGVTRAPFFRLHGRTGSDHIVPARQAALATRDQVIKGQIVKMRRNTGR